MFRTLARSFGAQFLILAVASLALQAQSGNSAFSGSVKDATGLAIPAAKVKITNRNSGVQVETVTNEEGLYRLGALLPGDYQLEVAAEGFDRVARGPVTLQVSQTLALDFALQVGAQSQTVQVTEAAPLVESQSSNVGQAVSRQMLEGLPLPNRAA